MKQYLNPAVAIFLIATTIFVLSFTRKQNSPVSNKTTESHTKRAKIQAAILLDVSGSMDGLIEQAKAQLWNMVNTMGKAKCDGTLAPDIEIALYEYGRSTNSEADGYVKQLSAFSSDLDMLSAKLFSLTTNGGDEYCGQVIYTSLKELSWDLSPENYKVIFIAGNEDFLQGNLLYTKACNEAKQKGVIVNTIYCGARMQGIKEHWDLSTECGNGSFSVIDQNQKIEEMPTPYDSILFTLNDRLNSTYMAYDNAGSAKFAAQASVDKMNYATNKSAALKRVEVKSKSNLYKNSSWDMVDADGVNEKFVETLDKKTLPDSLKSKSTEELKLLIKQKSTERSSVQKQIEETNAKRNAYIASEKAKTAVKNNTATLESEIEKVIKEQAKRFNMLIQ